MSKNWTRHGDRSGVQPPLQFVSQANTRVIFLKYRRERFMPHILASPTKNIQPLDHALKAPRGLVLPQPSLTKLSSQYHTLRCLTTCSFPNGPSYFGSPSLYSAGPSTWNMNSPPHSIYSFNTTQLQSHSVWSWQMCGQYMATVGSSLLVAETWETCLPDTEKIESQRSYL